MNRKGLGCFILFALPFVAAGAAMAIWLFVSIDSYLRMQNWIETPALVVKAELVEHSDSEGSNFETKAEYRYTFDNVPHQGTRVGVDNGADRHSIFTRTIVRFLPFASQGNCKVQCKGDRSMFSARAFT